MNSIWSETAKSPEFNALDGDIKTDVLIVGGGIAGILCAYELQKAGVDYALIESERICGGITKNTTAKITSQHGLIYQDLIKKFGTEKARAHYDAKRARKAETGKNSARLRKRTIPKPNPSANGRRRTVLPSTECLI